MRKALLTTLIVLAVLVGGGWVADNAVRKTAEERAAAAIASRLGLAQKPEVSLGGFPFSLALLTSTVPDAHAGAARVPLRASGHDIQLNAVRVTSGPIRLAGGTVHIAAADATGVLGYGDLGVVTGVPVAYGGDGRLRLTYTLQTAIGQVTVAALATPRLDPDAHVIRLADPRLDPANPPPVPVSGRDLGRLVKAVPVELGSGVMLTAFTPSEGGVAIGAHVQDVTLPAG